MTPTAMAVFAHEFVPEGEPSREVFERLPDLLASHVRAHFDAGLPPHADQLPDSSAVGGWTARAAMSNSPEQH